MVDLDGYINVWLAIVIGWIANIVQVVHTTAIPITGLFVLKCCGIFVFPLGSVLGWLGMLYS